MARPWAFCRTVSLSAEPRNDSPTGNVLSCGRATAKGPPRNSRLAKRSLLLTCRDSVAFLWHSTRLHFAAQRFSKLSSLFFRCPVPSGPMTSSETPLICKRFSDTNHRVTDRQTDGRAEFSPDINTRALVCWHTIITNFTNYSTEWRCEWKIKFQTFISLKLFHKFCWIVTCTAWHATWFFKLKRLEVRLMTIFVTIKVSVFLRHFQLGRN